MTPGLGKGAQPLSFHVVAAGFKQVGGAVVFGYTLSSAGFPDSSVGKESACNAGDLGSIPGLGTSSGEGKGYPFQYSGLENSMDCIVQGVSKSRTRLSNFHFFTKPILHVWGWLVGLSSWES